MVHYIPVLGLMTVKNERKNVKRTLKSFDPIVGRWLITDTGSTDGTQAKIKAVLRKLNKPFDIVNVQWVNYSYNKNLLLDGAKQLKLAYKYSLMVDAGDECKNSSSLFRLIHEDFDMARVPIIANKNVRHLYQPRLLKVDTNLQYRYRVHETIRHYTDTIINDDLLNDPEGFKIIHDYTKDTVKHRTQQDDVKMLEEDLLNPFYDEGDKRNRLENLVYALLLSDRKEEAMKHFETLIKDYYGEEDREKKTDEWKKIEGRIYNKISNNDIDDDAERNDNGTE